MDDDLMASARINRGARVGTRLGIDVNVDRVGLRHVEMKFRVRLSVDGFGAA